MYMSDYDYEEMAGLKKKLKKVGKKLKKAVKKVAKVALPVVGAVGGGILGAKAGQKLSKVVSGSKKSKAGCDHDSGKSGGNIKYKNMSLQQLLAERVRLQGKPAAQCKARALEQYIAAAQGNAVDSTVPSVTTQAAPVYAPTQPGATSYPADIYEPQPYIANGSGPQYPELEPIEVTATRPEGSNTVPLLLGAGLLGVMLMNNKGGSRRRGNI